MFLCWESLILPLFECYLSCNVFTLRCAPAAFCTLLCSFPPPHLVTVRTWGMLSGECRGAVQKSGEVGTWWRGLNITDDNSWRTILPAAEGSDVRAQSCAVSWVWKGLAKWCEREQRASPFTSGYRRQGSCMLGAAQKKALVSLGVSSGLKLLWKWILREKWKSF